MVDSGPVYSHILDKYANKGKLYFICAQNTNAHSTSNQKAAYFLKGIQTMKH